MPVKTINLDAAVRRVKSKLRDLPTDLLERFDMVATVAPISASEGKQAGIAALNALADCIREADINGDADDARDLGQIASAFCRDLRIWSDEAHRMELAFRRNWADPNIREHREARWESRGGKYWVELLHGPYDYHYRCQDGCGSVCNPNAPVEAALTVMQSKLDRGMFLPDSAKLPMKRVD
jgi:hypothetical protein